MADMMAIFGILLALGIAFPGMVMAWWMLFPVKVEAARTRVSAAPWRCLALGALGAGLLALPALLLMALPLAPAKLLGVLLLLAGFALALIGVAAIATAMAGRLGWQSDAASAPAKAVLAGAVALELAAFFPGIGWLLVIPLTALVAFGAAILALVGGPQRAAQERPASQPATAAVTG